MIEEKPLINDLINYLENEIGAYPDVLATITTDQVDLLRSMYFREVEELIGGQCAQNTIVDKLPLNMRYIDFINRVFPEGKIVLALRHPLDVCLSNFMQDFKLNAAMANFLSIEGCAELYADVFDLWFSFVKNFDLDLHVVKYEDLVEDFEKEAGGLISFLGLAWDDSVLDYHKHARKRDAIATPSYLDVAQPIFKRARYRWKNYRSHLAPIVERLRPYIKKHGYSFD